MSQNLDEKFNNYLDLYAGFSNTEASGLPLGYKKIYIKKILSIQDENKLMLYNNKYKYKGGIQGSDKPISKIVK